MTSTLQSHYESMMRLALSQARIAFREREVPIGAVICKGNDIISFGHNRRETGRNALYHAEIEAINNACRVLGGWRLDGCELYVTLEPCPMCAGAIINSRIKTVIFGAKDPKAGVCGSIINLFDFKFNDRPNIIGGILEDECSLLLKSFFADLRKEKNQNNNLESN